MAPPKQILILVKFFWIRLKPPLGSPPSLNIHSTIVQTLTSSTKCKQMQGTQ
jgi:hypothetical protein